MEPSVIAKATQALPMINPRNIHLSEQGNGAANNWQNGYNYGTQHQEELISLIDREVDKCDNLANFQLMHSVAGGTGSGVGSLLLELLNDRYGSKKLTNTFLVFPSNEKTSDVVVQPYNTILTLKRLIDYSDGTFVFDNDSLNLLENLGPWGGAKRHTSPGFNSSAAFQGANKLIAFVSASISNPLRFPGYMYSSYESILSTLIPTPDLKFLSTAIAPSNPSRSSHALNEYDMTLEMLDDRYKLNRVREPVQYLAVMNYLIGNNLSLAEIRKGALRAQLRVKFVPWTLLAIHLVYGRASPFVGAGLRDIDGQQDAKRSLAGVQVSNNTSVAHVLSKIVRQYDLLAKRSAYINFYTESNDAGEILRVLEEFGECREAVAHVIDEYQQCQHLEYLEHDTEMRM